MKSMSAKEAKNGFGLLLDTARAEPVMIEKHGRPVVVVLSTEEYERLLSRSFRRKEGSINSADVDSGGQESKRNRIGKAQAR
ncbi:type II toxin-antitoxin system Phd/YefM family antitoxin [Pelagibius sp.]|uniref:type II toxin-antitoxin system Phd/YefM family antitoxin n=1 Tax=Pelagibius sp. TaxID=1931238 RepID=UPI003B51241A